MVHMMSTTRAGRPSKDKAPKTNATQHTKTDTQPSSGNKHQPTAEQMRLAQMIKSEKGSDDPEIEEKIKQVVECTSRSKDDAYFALHDCDYDLQRAIMRLIEEQDQQGGWQEKKGKKKKQAAAKAETEPTTQNDTKPDRQERNNDHNDNSGSYERSSSAPRGRRNDRAPPRFQRAAAGRGRNDDERGDSSARGERGRGRGRGSRGRGRDRGMSGGGGGSKRRDYNDNRGSFENGPQIDTWTPETAGSKKQESSFGTWGDMAEDWNSDEWTGSLKESKVFTPSAQDPSNVFSTDNDAKMFTVSNIETQVFSSAGLGDSMNSAPSLNESQNRYQHTASPIQPPIGQDALTQDPLGPAQSLGQDPIGQSLAQKPIGQNALGQSTIGQRLDLGMLLGAKAGNESATSVTRQTEELAKQTADFISQFQKTSESMSQYQKQATESIKNAVGIGNSSQSGSMGLSPAPEPVMSQAAPQPAAPPQAPPQGQEQRPTVIGQSGTPPSGQQAGLQQRAKRSKLPPPSKIPQSAVVMPGGMNFGGGLDVKFGTWDQGESPSGFSFAAVAATTAPGVSSSYTAPSSAPSLNNHMAGAAVQQNNHLASTQQPQNNKPESPAAGMASAASAVTSQQAAMSTMLEGMSQQQAPPSPRPAATAYPKPPPATPPKEYSQSAKISSPPEPIPFPQSSTQTDRKSPYQPSGSLASEPAGGSQQLNYSQSNYSSAYSSGAYKPTVPATVSSGTSSYTSQNNGLPGSSLSQTGLQDYRSQSSAFQSQSGYSSQGQNSLYPSTNPPSSFQSNQNASSYQTTGSGGYQSQNSYHNRDSQSAPAFQSSVSQSGSSYQNSVSQSSGSYQNSVSQTGGSSYQRDSESSQSAYGNQSAYGSSNNSQKLSSTKLSDSIGKLTVKDSSLDQTQSQYDSNTVSQSTSFSSNANTNSTLSSAPVSIATGAVTVSAVLGLTTPTANSVATGVNLSSLPSSKSTGIAATTTTTKAPPNLPPGVPPLNYMHMPQGFPIATAFGLQQPPALYSYEDLLLSQQRLPVPSYYDNLQFQPTPTTLAGLDHSKLAAAQAVPYNTGAPDASKLSRVEAQSPTNTQTSQPTQPQSQSTAHGQTFINPHSIPPGYAAPSYYYQMPPGAGYTYGAPMIPLNNLMTQVTNAGASSASNQFPKANYGFGSGTATQDYNKAYVGASQTQSKSVSAASSVSSASDLTAPAGYPKSHSQAFDKSGFAAGTPPPYGMTGLPTPGSQAGPMGAPAYVQYVPGLAAAQPSAQMLAHQLHQDSLGGSSRGAQQTSSAPKGLSNKTGYGATAYWSTN